MNVEYDFLKENYTYSLVDDVANSYLLSNTKGDFFHQGINHPTTKFNGYSYCDSKTLDVFKIIDEFFLDTKDVNKIKLSGYQVQKEYSGENSAKDFLYLGPTGGLQYSIENYKGRFSLDLDMRKHDDFDEWGREYSVYRKGSRVFVKYEKKVEGNTQYRLYFGLDLPIEDFTFKQEWVKKHYPYSQLRDSLCEWYVFRVIDIDITTPITMFMAAGKSEEEVENQLYLLQHHGEELKNYDKTMQEELLNDSHFLKPLTQDVHVAYNMAKLGMYKLLSKNLEGPLQRGSYAGLPWFHQIWARDELVGLRGYLENQEYSHVVEKIYDYINEIDENTGKLPRLHKKGSLESADGIFWLAKRIEDLVFHLDEKGQLTEYVSMGEIEYFYSKLTKAFSQIITQDWNSELELLHTKQGDSWMDTLTMEYSLDIQVQLLGCVSTLGVLAGILHKGKDEEHYLDLEYLLTNKIRAIFYDGKKLYNDREKTIVNANIFLSYYFYPNLFTQKEWEGIFDNSLKELKCSWGGITSLSKFDANFRNTYSGENNESYHRGDSWYWINNIAAIVLNNCNEKKYRDTITSILLSSTKDIISQGTLGFGSELSSAKKQEPRGNLAQLWSMSTYVEMVHHLFDKEHL